MSNSNPVERSRPESIMRTSQWVCAWIAVAAPALAGVLSIFAVNSDDVGWAMVTALLVMPAAIVLSIVFGTLTVILSIVLRVKYDHRGTRWVTALVLGIVALVLPPVVLAVLFASVG